MDTNHQDPHQDKHEEQTPHDNETEVLLRSIDESVLWDEVWRRCSQEIGTEDEHRPEQSGGWTLTRAKPQKKGAAPSAQEISAVIDATYVRECLLAVGLHEAHSCSLDGGFLVIASDVAQVFYWGDALGGHAHPVTEARTMLNAYTEILGRRGVHATLVGIPTERTSLCLRCRMPHPGLGPGDVELKLEALFNAGGSRPERADDERRLALAAVRRILSDLGNPDDLFTFLEPSGKLHLAPEPINGVRPLDRRTQLIMTGLLDMQLTGAVPHAAPPAQAD